MADQLVSHLFINGRVAGLRFQAPVAGRGKKGKKRDVGAHGRRLLAQLDELAGSIDALEAARAAADLPQRRGMSISVEFAPSGAFDCSKVEWKRDAIELLSVQVHTNSDIAVLHVPDGRLSAFVNRINEYVASENEGTVKQAALVNAIENIRRTAFKEMWHGPSAPPVDTEPHWFQIWLRHSSGQPAEVVAEFIKQAELVGLEVEPGHLVFPGRIVVAAYGTRKTFEQAVELLDLIAEVRPVEPTAEFFLSELTPAEQAQWVNDLLARTNFAEGESPHICLLDTGVNHGHPLLAPALADDDLHTFDPTWQKNDHAGHGSEMAGIALYGNLMEPLSSGEPLNVPHRLESVKVLPPDGETPPKLWGSVVSESVSRVEVTAARRSRVFAMMTTSVGHLLGAPSEWSATIDQLAFGRYGLSIADVGKVEEEEAPRVPRLFVLSAGNVPWPDWADYPRANGRSPIQNPGQAWNALTVGAMTSLVQIDGQQHPDLSLIADAGDLSPASTTSVLWAKSSWPLKPDVVAEGGNATRDAFSVNIGPESLRVLTTSNTPGGSLLSASGDTSAAAAEVARLCAHARSQYPDYWPETIRALIVHGADHTPTMRGHFPEELKREDKNSLLRTYGYGLVDAETVQFSTAHRPTLVVQRQFNPYLRQLGGYIGFGAMQLHDLPWPVEELHRLSEAQVELRVTLSYFVEPNPSARGWQSKFRYQSFGLRFAVKAASEDEEQFLQRINKLEREASDSEDEDDEIEENFPDPDVKKWRFGPQIRARGSIHSDVWTGSAEQLALKSQIAVIPVGGWWKYWKEAKQHATEARYALVVSLRVSEELDADVYTPIATEIGLPAVVDIDINGAAG